MGRATGHLLSQLHAVAVAHLPLLLQVLRLRDPPRPPLLPGRGRNPPRRRGPPQREGAARADRRGAGGQSRGRRAARLLRAPGLRLLRRLGVRVRARAGDPPAHEPWRPRPRRPRPAARGDRVAGADAGVDLRTADGNRPRRLADQASGAPAADDRGGGRAADPVHERNPGRDRRDRGGADRLAGGARRVASPPRPSPGGDPPELRRPSELLRARGGRDRGWRCETQVGDRGRRSAVPGERCTGRRGRLAYARVGDPDHPRRHEAPGFRSATADARRRRPDPAQPLRLVARPGRRRCDRSRRPLGERRPHLARAGVPEPASGPQAAQPARLRAHRATLRLPAIPRFRLARAERPRRRQAQVLELHPAARVGKAHRARDRPEARSAGDRARPRGHRAERGRAHRAVRRDPPRGDRGDADRGGRAARRAGRRGGDVRRQPQRQLHQHLRRRLRLLRLRPGQALARRLPRERGGVRRRGSPTRSISARPRSACRGDPPRLLARALRPLAAARQADRTAASPARLLADGDPLHVRALRPLARPRLRLPARVWPRFDPRHRRGGARRRRPKPGSRRTSCPPAAGSRSSRHATVRACARPRP